LGVNLYIWTESGDWYTLVGQGDPDTSTLYHLGKFRVPNIEEQPGIWNNKLIFMASDGRTICTVDEDQNFDEESLRHLESSNRSELLQGILSKSPPSVSPLLDTVTIPTNKGSEYHLENNVWTYDNSPFPSDKQYVIRPSLIGSHEWAFVETPGILDGEVWWELYVRDVQEDGELWNFFPDADFEKPVGRVFLPRIDAPRQFVRVTKVWVDVEFIGDYTPETHELDVYLLNVGEATALSLNTSDLRARRHGEMSRYIFTPKGTFSFDSKADLRLDFRGFRLFDVQVEYELSERMDF